MKKLRDEYLLSIINWAKNNNVQALIQTGSLARKDGSVDELSDIDIEIITQTPSDLMNDDQWLHEIGELVTVLCLDPDAGQQWATRLAIYKGGIKVDYTIAGLERINKMVREAQLDDLYERGYNVVFDVTDLTNNLPSPSHGKPLVKLPSNMEFLASVEEFWFEASHIPKYLARGELWLVKQRDWNTKELLLTMVEWHTIASSSGAIDVWHNGLRLQEWLDPKAWEEIQDTFSHFDARDAQRAFDATVKLYARLGKELADCLGFDYPHECEKEISAVNSKILSTYDKNTVKLPTNK
ncbi:TPA: aminoglycoside 6-adenylyltransferase [Serratia marcescens]|nr:aminoglycoside 6-adenylyltransferase [Serratia marcescens]